MTDSIHSISRSDLIQLVNFWFGGSLPRPLRRRMLEIGLLQMHAGKPCFTVDGTRFIRENAPRSPWPAKSTPIARRYALRQALATAAIFGATQR